MNKRALLSVSNKEGLEALARGLFASGYELCSSGGTARYLQELGLPVTPVEAVTGFKECLGGRVKTLHPHIHAGILARRELAEDMQTLADLGIAPIDLVCVNLYPFAYTVATRAEDLAACIEEIDIGGPSMLRAAAKNAADVTVLCDPADYDAVLATLPQGGPDLQLRRQLALKVFQLTAAYDAQIAAYLAERLAAEQTPASDAVEAESSSEKRVSGNYRTLPCERVHALRYGENPQQSAEVWRSLPPVPGSLVEAKILQGKALSYNNYADADAALALIREFKDCTVLSLKHASPCGLATAEDVETAYARCYAADPVSIYGGIVAQNREVSGAEAEAMSKIFLEIILAPSFSPAALEVLSRKKNLRLLEVPQILQAPQAGEWTYKAISGGFLRQSTDYRSLDSEDYRTVVGSEADQATRADAVFGMTMVKHVRSNAIVVVKDLQSLGVGGGQCNRVTAARLALEQAGEAARGAVLASDAFLPFADTVELAAQYGIGTIVQPGGSIRDDEVIAACEQAGIRLIMTGQRHFKH